MFILHGEYDSQTKRGVVADKCAHCRKITLLQVTQHFRKSHLYLIPLGRGKLVATVLTCTECRGKIEGTLEQYAGVLPQKQAQALSLGEVLQETNPRLAGLLAYRARLEREARDFRPVDPTLPDPRVKLAFARLAELDLRDPQVIELQARLAQWGCLDEAGRNRVLREVDAHLRQMEEQEVRFLFIQSMAQNFKADVDGGLAFLTFIGLLALGIAGSVWLLGEALLGAGIVASIVAASVCSYLAHRWLCRRTQRRFFRTKFLPEAESRGVDVGQVVQVLAHIRAAGAHADEKLLKLAQALPLLEGVLKEQALAFDPEGA